MRQVELPVVDQVKETHAAGEREPLRDEVRTNEPKKEEKGQTLGVCVFVCLFSCWDRRPGEDLIFGRGKQL